jgi:hypothetical protein
MVTSRVRLSNLLKSLRNEFSRNTLTLYTVRASPCHHHIFGVLKSVVVPLEVEDLALRGGKQHEQYECLTGIVKFLIY